MKQKIKKTALLTRRSVFLFIALVFASSLFFFLYKPHKAHAQIFITSGTTWTVPTDWSNSNNTIEVIGAGGGGGSGLSDSSGSGGEGGGGGGAGAYSKATNVTLSPGSTVTIKIGTGGGGGTSGASGVVGSGGTAGGDTYLCNSTTNCSTISGTSVVVGAKGGSGGGPGGPSGTVGPGGAGGLATGGIGSTKFNGGTGGNGSSPVSGAGGGGGGAGGAGGPNTAGNNGTTATGTSTGQAGGQGDGTAGGGGGSTNGGTGGNGTEYDASHGSGGGGGGGTGPTRGSGTVGGNGGNYGGGGGGGGGNGSKQGSGGGGGGGIQGMIRVTYNFTAEQDYRWRLDDGNETTGTSLAAQDTAASINYGTNVRLRISLANLGDTTTFSYALQYAPYSNGCYTWTTIPATATTQEFNMYNSTNITDQGATTNVSSGPGVITDPSGYTFTAGKFVSNTSNTATSQVLGTQQFTEVEYAIQPNSNATNGTYCFRVTTSAGTPLDSYATYPILNINYPPSAPTIYSVVNGSTNVPRLPVFNLKSSDYNRDYIKYVVEVCPANSWPCASGGVTYDETSAQTCWTGQDAQTATAYIGRNNLANSTLATCSFQLADLLNPNTTYYMRAKGIDPGGSNTFGAYSSVVSWTTSTLEVRITGGTSITGGTKIGG